MFANKSIAGLLIICHVCFLYGCASTPDLSVWSQSSAVLANSVKAGQNQILEGLDETIAQIEIGGQEGWPDTGDGKTYNLKDWRDGNSNSPDEVKKLGYRKSFVNSQTRIDNMMKGMVSYSNALANLAAAGETGKKASESILESITGLLSAAGMILPAGNVVKELVVQLSDKTTRIQAQNKLASTMEEIQPAIDQVATKIKEITEKHREIVANIYLAQDSLAFKDLGTNQQTWYEDNCRSHMLEIAFKHGYGKNILLMCWPMIIKNKAYQAKRRDIMKWKETMDGLLDHINEAADTWSEAHAEARTFLVNCGGIRSLRSGCGTYSMSNLLLVAGSIQNITAQPDKGQQ